MRQKKADKIIKQLTDTYDSIAGHFSQTRYRLWPEMIDWKKYLSDDMKVLDVGCGSGRLLDLFSDKPSISYYGIDSSARLVDIAKDNCQNYTLKDIKFQVGNVLSLPYDDDYFDQVYCVATLQHVPSEKYRMAAVTELKRVLKKGGYLFLTNWYLWNKQVAKKYHIKKQQNINWLRGLDSNDLYIPWHDQKQNIKGLRYYHAFKKTEIKQLLASKGFDVKKNYIVSSDPDKKKDWQRENLVTIAIK